MWSKTLRLPLALVFSLSLIYTVSAQKRSDRETDGLRGPVKAVRIEIVSLDKNGQPDEHGRWLSRLTSYNDKGKKTEDETFYCFGGCSYGKYTYKHDSAGNLIEQSHQLGPRAYKRSYFYNEIGQLFMEDRDDPPSHLEYSYDAEGKLTEVKESWADGTPSGIRKVRHRNRDHIVEQFLYDAKGNLGSKIIRTYDNDGRTISEANGDDPDYEYYHKAAYKYDDRGNVVEEIKYDHSGLWGKTTYTYEFDLFGNWIKQTAVITKGGEKTVYETYRTLTYDDMQGRYLLNLILNLYTAESNAKHF